MPKYVILINFTDQGMKAIKDLTKRVNAARDIMEKVGGKFLDWNLTMGQYDSVAIVEVPDDATLARIALAVGRSGNIRTTTLKAFTETEMTKIVEEIP